MNLFEEGGALFMYTILIVLIISIALIVKDFFKPDEKGKTLELIKSLGLFALVWGFLGMMIGFIGAFDAISDSSGVSQSVLASGLKVGLLAPSFGMFAFLVIRLGIIGLILKKK
ncbi:MotA/TolQ/ExbB proton channel family protein [Polaribacter haliotis]|uniref:MotA/TolQ/ExbB proton channel family protein n=1 Tax=Polaribacter haliotis TaxID=1888915 RepID=A0A7L8AEU7_9FLAO|nr:MotA/TolQ/ExbB proton channel family protein [Polaribacter haliotis]QOD60520.1 MotA/TolQ/ExbB proton channel family protein [Polaribacter haliotis]